MRNLLIATGLLALMADAAVAQQRPGAPYPPPGEDAPRGRPMPPPPAPPPGRWGSKIGDRWWAGANAPGGWNAYRRPHRGWALPPYWISSRFGITDWQGYDLPPPPPGYRWTRYYDDAVMVDQRGSVRDSIDGVDWDRPGYIAHRRPPPPPARYDQPYDDGGYGDRGYGYPPLPPPPHRWVSPDGQTTVTTTTVGGEPGGYLYEDYPDGATRVTVQSAPVVTTTTTEYIEQRAPRTRPAKRVRSKQVRRAR